MKRFTLMFLLILLLAYAHAGEDKMLGMAATSAAKYIDLLCMDTLAMLQQIARSPEAGSAKWEAIYPQLEAISHRLPGVYFFVLPDGNYYSVDKGYTNLNLSNRGYFESLFAGNPVLGYEIYSRSSGQKSALMAAPIIVQGKVVGALGSSLFLDDMHVRVNRELSIPEDYTWFAVNNQGLTMLDQDKDFIFMNALTQGTPSLSKAISEALKGSDGEIEYDLGNTTRKGRYARLPSLDWRLILVERGTIQSQNREDISLATFSSELQQSLNDLDQRTRTMIKDSKLNWTKESAVRGLLEQLLDEHVTIVDAAFVDAGGHIKYIEPAEYRNSEGRDISGQSHVQILRKDKRPVFSDGFLSVEGQPAISIAYPVFEGKKLIGSVSLLINPVIMIDGILKDINVPSNHELCIMQRDGYIIYDLDEREIGKNLFHDSMFREYESLLKLGESMAAKASGSGEYVFQSAGHLDKVLKRSSWTTVKLHNQEWRVLMAMEI